MATITATLAMEHAVFRTVFDHIERVLPDLTSVPEVRALSAVVEVLLGEHAKTETDLDYATLDHALAEKGQLDRMHHDHKEIDTNFELVRYARTLAEARRLLKRALAASREHFRYEEREVFPLLERVLHGKALNALGEASLRKRPVSVAG